MLSHGEAGLFENYVFPTLDLVKSDGSATVQARQTMGGEDGGAGV